MNKIVLSFLFAILFSFTYAQNYTVLGNGVNFSGCNCFKLTDAVDNQGGAAYQNQTINLNNSFDYQFNLFFGCDDAGADGIVFVLTNNITGLGQSGGGLGYGGLAGNSFAVEFDTYQNGGEPANDHIAFESAGSVGHNIAGPVDAMAGGGNIEDCGYHTVRLVWDVNTNTFSVYFDGSLRLSQVFPSFINTFFGGNPIVNWGFSASTGGANNEQRFCVISNSNWTAGTNFQSCTKTIQFTDISTSNIGTVAGWAWNFGEPSSGAANTSTLQNPSHTYASNGTYTVTLTITDNSGCTNTYSHPVVINAPITLSPTTTSPLCNGGTNGSIAITPSGGFGASTGYYLPSGYDYTWFDGTKGSSHVGLTAGTYTVTATDGVCSATGTYTLNQPTALSAVVSKTDANCGINNGTASITISGGTPPYTGINWGPGHPGASVTGLSPGTFIADFHDANGCSSLLQYSATIGSLPCGVTSSITTTNVSCFGGANGTATLTVTGSSGTVNISWSNGMTGASISGLAAGTYTYNYSDALPAHAFSGSITITQPGAAMVADINTVDMSCAGSNNGQALASVLSGGTTPYSYAWSGGQPNSPSVTGLSAGPISVTITDGSGCTATASGNITGPPTLTLSITKVDDSCYQANHGSATAIVGGGNGGYTYDWSNNIPGQTNYNLGAGTYTVTVTDSKGCTITGSTTIAQPASGLSNSITKQDVNCFGISSGSITTNVSGGTPTYTYSWSPGSVSGSAPTGLAAGTYFLTVSDNKACALFDTITITQPDSALSVTTSHTDVKCHGGSDGTVTITISGGTPPYTYLGNPIPAGTTTIPSLAAGTYAGNIVDSKSCFVAVSETVTEPAVQSLSLTSTNNVCFGGATATATANFVNATGVVSYNWNPGGVLPPNRTGLTSGTYAVTATDANACTVSGTTTITEPTAIVHPFTSSNIDCFGNSTGSITTNVSGGTPAYTYTWNPATASGAAPTGLASGTYYLTVSDNNSCNVYDTITLTQPAAALSVTTSHTDVKCHGGSDGTVTITISGGTPPYTYLGNPIPAGTTTIPSLAAGTYAGNIVDNKSCFVAVSETVTEPAVQSLSLTSTNNVCFGGATATATANFVNATGVVSYNWNPGGVLPAARTGLTSGTYAVTATDANLCTVSGTTTITEPTAIVHPFTSSNIDCFGNSTGSITTNVSGGTPAYTYTWNPATASGAAPTGLASGTYYLTVSDNNSCNVYDTITLSQPAAALSVTTSHTDVKCHGGSDGTVTITISGGTPPYTYLGNPIPAGTTTIPSLAAGTYAGNIVDNNNCSVAVSETVTEPAVQSLTLTSTNNVCFGGATATATADFVNATGLVSYNWNPGGVLPAARTGLTSGTYAVTATDANLCTVSGTTTITEPTAIVHPYTSTNINCFGNATGTITTNVSGGTPTYTYTWNPATASGATPTGLASGTYYLTISDNNSCQVFDTITLSQPAAALTVTTSHTDVKCHGGSDGTVTITISGGTAPYTYLGNPIPAGTTTIPSLAAGTYAGNIVDNNNCSVAVSETVTEPAVQSLTLTSTNNVCFGGATATATADFVNATGLVSYNWNPGGVLPATRTGLTSGTYAVTATDANLCTVSGTTTITEPTAIVHPYTSTNINCFGNATGTITTNVSGGTPTYTYTWNPATASGATPTGLASGTYYLTISDNNSCQVFDTITLTQPAAALTVTTSHTDVKCHGESDGTVTINISGGTAPYTYLGNPIPAGTTTIPSLAAGTYAGNIVDNNNCSVAVSETVTEPAVQSLTLTSTNNVCFGGATATATADFVNATGLVSYNWNPGGVLPAARTGLTSGTYDVTATDANSCTLTASTTITEPASPIMTITAIDASCFGGNGSATANPSGAGPFTFAWSNSGVGQTITPIAGTYTVTATDLALCQQTATGTINQPTAVAVTPNQVDINCFGATTGSIVLSVSGGTAAGAYNYTWSPNVSTTASASSLGAGSYAITVTDDNSCSATVTVTLAQPASALSYTVSSVDKQCNGGVNDGRIVYATSGGTAPYTFTWSANASSAIDSAINLDAGTYDVTITDSKGCSVTNSVTITQPVSPLSVLSQSQNNVSCFGGNNGSATVVAQGGTIGYSYAWTPNVSSSATASGLSLGGYSVTITDSHGCSVNTAFTITEPAALTASAVAVATTCNAGSDGSVAVNAAGGTPAAAGYVYTWNPNVSTTNAASGLIAGTYTITVSDSLACSVTASAIVTSPTAVGLTETHTNEPCFGDALGTVQLSASGGTPAYTLELENGGVYSASPNGFFNGLLAGTYNIRVTDSKGCPTTSSVTITEPSAIAIAAVFDTVKCFGESNGAISASASGGASGYSFAFSNGVTNTTGSISGLPAANYTVTVTDVNGCSTATTLTVTQPDAVEITLSPVDSLVLNLGEGQVITASSNYSDAVFNWSPATGLGCSDCNSNEIKVYNSTAYVITASTSPHGKVCSTAVRLPVTVIPNYKLYIPNAFTPNADGINDLYEIFGNKDAIKFLDIAIFNRWGEKVYESKDIFFQWDGRYKGVYLEPGVYVYTINITFLDNHSESNQRGSITILR